MCDKRELLKKRKKFCSKNNNNSLMTLSHVYVMMQAFNISPLSSVTWSTWCMVVVENSVHVILKLYYK